jgi:mRNA interferase RelE/StbE
MNSYQLEIPTRVRRQIDRLPGHYRQRVKAIIQQLPSNPRPSNAKLLREKGEIYRIALDQYRIVYSIENDVLVIEVVKVGRKYGPEFYADI